MKPMALLARILFFLAQAIGSLPLSLQRGLGRCLGRIFYRLNTRAAKVARRNFEYMQLVEADQREALVREVMCATGQNLVETLRVWTQSEQKNLALIKSVYGLDALEAAQALQKGVIIAAPHYGNWELLIEYMAARGVFALVYRVPEKKWGDDFLRRARGGENIVLVPAETNAMRPLWKTLQANAVVGITPDQQPKLGGGEFAPFFGKAALSLSLICKLAERSKAPVVFAYTEANASGFDVYFEAADMAIASQNVNEAVAAMNAQVENIARRDLRQYQWTYKRYTIRPENSEDENPYWPDCY
jgi:Kdo2-lipid IVA lauroyltransferase/acyltransferase